jgi:CRP-like cAMP-binding protein
MAPATFVRVLEEDTELAAVVAGDQRDAVRVASVAPLIALQVGPWRPPQSAHSPGRDLGLLVLGGLLSRDFEIAGRTFTELRGPEDILRPWDDAREASSVRAEITWSAVEPTRLAWLDGDFAAAVAPWPEIAALLLERAVRRARLLSFRLAILELKHIHLRVLLLLWHLSDRWGHVRPDGVHLDLPLTHGLIARMVGAHRTSVTAAMHRLAAEGLVARGQGHSWLLLGGAPDELSDL